MEAILLKLISEGPRDGTKSPAEWCRQLLVAGLLGMAFRNLRETVEDGTNARAGIRQP